MKYVPGMVDIYIVNVVFKQFQSEAGWLGFYMTIAGGVSGLLIGRYCLFKSTEYDSLEHIFFFFNHSMPERVSGHVFFKHV